MKLKKVLTILLLVLTLPFMGCGNVLLGMANRFTDEALYEEAKKAMNDQDWDAAISNFEDMSADYKAKPEVIEDWAYVYAGKCGLNFIEFFQQLGSASLTGSSIFKYFMNAWTSETVSASHCTLAQQKMEEISANPAVRTSSQNLFMAILGIVKIGVYLQEYGDRDRDGDASEINVCTDDNDNLPEAALDEVITGMGLITSNLVYLTAVLSSGDITNALTTVNTVCAVSPGSCGRTDPADITSGDRNTWRDILKTAPTNPEVPMGIGDCNNTAVTVPACC